MSELVEKVAKAMCENKGVDPYELHDFGNGQVQSWVLVLDEARAAIAAVAEWMEKDHGDDWFKARHLRAQLEQPK